MRIAAMILGILGGLGLLGIGMLGFTLGEIGAGADLKVVSLAIPIAALVGAGIVVKKPSIGGGLMLLSALATFGIMGVHGFSLYLGLPVLIAGMLGLLDSRESPVSQRATQDVPGKKCPSCGTEYPASARFCSVDGYRFESSVLTRSAESYAQPEIPSAATSEQQDTLQEHKSEEVAVDITTATPPVSEIVSASRIEAAPSTTSVQSGLEAFAASETVERQHQPTPRSEIKRPAIPTWAIPLGGIIAAGLLGYFGFPLFENKQELEGMPLEEEAQERTAQQEVEARRVAEQKAEYERRARQEAAAREAEAQRKAQGEADARKRAQEQAAAEKRARQEASATEAEILRKAQQEAGARRRAQAIEAQQIAREQAAAERKASLKVEGQRKYQDNLARLEKRYYAAQERAKKRYSSALGRANGRADRVARAEDYYQKALAKAQKYYEQNRIKVESRYQDALTKAQKASE